MIAAEFETLIGIRNPNPSNQLIEALRLIAYGQRNRIYKSWPLKIFSLSNLLS